MLWQRVHDGASIKDCKTLYEDICKLAVLSGIEIDKAKREYDVDTGKEINKLKLIYKRTEAESKWIPISPEEYNSLSENPKLTKIDDKGNYLRKIKEDKEIKPMFFKMITLGNGYALNEKHKYIYFDTPMDYVQKIVNGFSFNAHREKDKEIVPFANIVKPYTCIRGGTYLESRDTILQFIRDTKKEINSLYIGYDEKNADDKAEVRSQVAIVKQRCIDYINNMAISQTVMYLLLQAIDKNKKHKTMIFHSLFGSPNKNFYECIQQRKEEISIIKEQDTGDLVLYGITYKHLYLGE